MTVQEVIDALNLVKDKGTPVRVSPTLNGNKSMNTSNPIVEVQEYDDQVCLWRDL